MLLLCLLTTKTKKVNKTRTQRAVNKKLSEKSQRVDKIITTRGKTITKLN